MENTARQNRAFIASTLILVALFVPFMYFVGPYPFKHADCYPVSYVWPKYGDRENPREEVYFWHLGHSRVDYNAICQERLGTEWEPRFMSDHFH